MKKRIFSILLICCMVFSLFPVSALAVNSNMPFTDVKTTDWFYKEVCYVYDEGLMEGTSATTFNPNGTTSRGMIVTILYRLEGEPSFMNDNIFTDVVPGSWYEKAVVWANGKGIVEGYGNEKFGPDDPITREQLATIMYRYANYKGYDTAAKADLSDFVDSGKISSYALDAMKWANAAGLINGVGASKLDPQGDATRAQVAAIFYRFCNEYVTEKTYTVTFDLNYGSDNTYTIQNVKSGEKAIKPSSPYRPGYSFSGWYTQASGGAVFDFDTAIAADVTLYAHWHKNNPVPYIPPYNPPTPPVLTPVEAPTAATGLTYDGTEQTGIAEATGYTIADGKATNAGSYTATATLAAGYKWSDGTTAAKQINWSIAKAELTATADDKTVTVGDEAPAYTVTYTGWVNGESIETVTPTTDAELACDYATTSAAGEYDITFAMEPVFANYSVTTVSGTLTAAPAAETKTVAKILATVESFPTAVGTGWKNQYGSAEIYYMGSELWVFGSGNSLAISGSTVLEKKDENTYSCKSNTYGETWTFTISDNVLSSVKISGDLTGMLSLIKGTYAPPATPTFKAVAVKDGKVTINEGEEDEAEADAYDLTFYYDALDHSSEGIVYDPVYTAPAGENPTNKALRAAWGYNDVREQIKSVKIDNSVKDYHGLTSMAYMLYNFENAEGISGTENLDVSNVTSMKSMFDGYGYYAENFNSIPNLSGWNTAKVTNMSDMFSSYGCSSTVLNVVPNVSSFNTSNVTDMSDMFSSYGYSSTMLDVVPNVSGFDTAKVTDMNGMFYEYGYGSNILNAVPDVSKFITDQVTDMHDMFSWYGCTSTALSSVPNVSDWNTEKVTNMSNMFNSYGYSSETLNFTLDLSGWNVGNVSDYDSVFADAASATSNWSVTIPAKTGEKVNDPDNWYFGDGASSIKPATDRKFTVAGSAPPTFKAVYNTKDDANTLTFYYDAVDHSGDNITVYEDGTANYLFNSSKSNGQKWGYNGIRTNVKSVVIDSSVANYKGLTSTTYMFSTMQNTGSVSGAEYLDVSNVTDMSYMFNQYGYKSSGLNTVPNVSGWNTGKVTNLSRMFQYYGYQSTALNTVPDVSGWSTGNVTNMSYMFYYYGNKSTVLNSVPNVSGWNTGEVTDLSNMFDKYGYRAKTLNFTLDLSEWSVAKVTNYSDMFNDAGAAITDPSKWSVTIPAKTGEQTNDATHWYVGNGTDTEKCIIPATDREFTVAGSVTPTFKAVYNTKDDANTLTFYYDAVDHSGDNITVYDNLPTAATQPNSWGYNGNRSNIKSVVIDSSVANYNGLTSTAYMFQGMNKAESISGAEYLDVSNVTTMLGMFYNFGSSSTTLNTVPNVADWNTAKVTTMANMFQNYGNNSTVLDQVPDVSGWSTGNVTSMSNMFNSYGGNSTALTKVSNMSAWSTGSVTAMANMFCNYGKASTVLNAVPNVSQWNTGKVTNMSSMFEDYGSSSTALTAVPNVSGWNTENVTNMRNMFEYYGEASEALNAVPNVSGWNTEKVTNMGNMFKDYGSSSTALTAVPNVSGWKTGNVTNMASMFESYGKASTVLNFTLDLSGWSVGSVSNYNVVFTDAAAATSTWSVTIPAKTGETENTTEKWFVGDGKEANKSITPASGKSFTVDAPAAPTVAVTGVSLDQSSIELQVGGEATLVATVLPENATNKNVTWSSDNTGVATVDNEGKVTGVAAGEATITVTTEDGSKTATCTVTVTSATPATKTIANILPDDFPTDPETGWENQNKTTIKLIKSENILLVVDSELSNRLLMFDTSTELTPDNNNYSCVNSSNDELEFQMNGNVLSAIVVTASNTDLQDFTGTYNPPAAPAPEVEKATVTIHVTRDSANVENVQVELYGNNIERRYATTDTLGLAVFEGIPTGYTYTADVNDVQAVGHVSCNVVTGNTKQEFELKVELPGGD